MMQKIIWAEVTFNNHPILISSVYRPPGKSAADVQSFLNTLQNTIDLAVQDNPHSINILGDFNDRCIEWNSNHQHSELGNSLVNLLNNNNLYQLIQDQTRDNHILDLLITDSPNYYIETGVLPSLSDLDHNIIFGHMTYIYNSPASYLRHVWQYDRGDYGKLNNIF